MPIDSNIEDLENLILETSDYVEKDVPAQLSKLVTELQQEMSQGVPVDSGELRSSIKVILNGYELSIAMLAYGYFQSFGVKGTKGDRGVMGVPSEVAGSFGVTEGYKFNFKSKVISDKSGLPFAARKKIAEKGLKPFDFYPTDIEDKIIEILTNNG